jgi:periplasmic protein CpxP/Spy
MKHLVLPAAISFCLAFSVVAVPSHATPQASEAAKKLEAVLKQLNLTPEQKGKLLPILEAEAPKPKAIKSDTTLTNLQKLEKIRAIHQETDPKVKSILNATQYEQWPTIREQEMREMMDQQAPGN